jgi:hypothetical protein
MQAKTMAMTDEQLDEIVAMLRACHADAVDSEGDYYADQFSFRGGGEAADAIEWLRREVLRLRLTDDEEEAIRAALGWLLWCEQNHQIGDGGRKDIAALRGMLDRTNHDAAAEIERLRLTDAEREAIAAGLGALERLYEDSPPISRPIYEEHAPTLRGLLERASTTSPPGSSGGKINRSAERQSPASDRVEAKPLDDCVQTMGSAPGGRGHFLSGADEIERLRNGLLGARKMGHQEPVAWRVYDTDGSEAVYLQRAEANAAAYELNWSVEPLYRSPPITDAEREAIERAMCSLAGVEDLSADAVAMDAAAACTLSKLADRLC